VNRKDMIMTIALSLRSSLYCGTFKNSMFSHLAITPQPPNVSEIAIVIVLSPFFKGNYTSSKYPIVPR
jgi:hypothetical protein